LISTFLLTCGAIFHHFKLGFSTALIIIVYVGAIAILFLFIVMLIPIKELAHFGVSVKRVVGQFVAVASIYLGGGYLIAKNVLDSAVNQNSEF
jgi:NADH:ubiquinone oxidoreductase subunit 6 (subunit J)